MNWYINITIIGDHYIYFYRRGIYNSPRISDNHYLIPLSVENRYQQVEDLMAYISMISMAFRILPLPVLPRAHPGGPRSAATHARAWVATPRIASLVARRKRAG